VFPDDHKHIGVVEVVLLLVERNPGIFSQQLSKISVSPPKVAAHASNARR
jgi:hypothetical protein